MEAVPPAAGAAADRSPLSSPEGSVWARSSEQPGGEPCLPSAMEGTRRCPRLRLLPPEGSAGSELHPAVPGAELWAVSRGQARTD